MSLVGTRPPTVDEWDKYELHHRARLATKPGLTGMWQVSGRSNITDFEEVVKLDKQYISEWTMGLDIKILYRYCRSYQTLKEHPNIDFSQVYILVRLYEVNDDEDIVKDITYATNSQNPIDFRDLKSNDSIQILLETSAADLVNIFLHI